MTKNKNKIAGGKEKMTLSAFQNLNAGAPLLINIYGVEYFREWANEIIKARANE